MADTKLFDDWNVQLAKTYKDGMLEPGTWFSISQKINGVRATCFGDKLISRTGHEILGFDGILADIKKLSSCLGGRFAFDGELRLKDYYTVGLDDNAAFKQSVGIANTQNDFSNKYKLNFIIFDVIPLKTFAYEQPTDKYTERLRVLNEIKYIIAREYLPSLQVVPILYSGTDISMIDQCAMEAEANGWEGVMINLDKSYQYKRTGNILKYKQFKTIDLMICGYTEGTGKYEGTLGAIVCHYKNNLVAVGSGFTDEQRMHIWANRPIYMGRIIEVKYKDVTSDKFTGLESLQFPVFKGFRMDKDKPDA